ncbi:hypothetical protein H920_03081 [Fukomys damarensis]|uniref:Uncharacterized protein n=1 Tax=Fukomys damarensis TaxID=885580 RepID=A0A091EJ28_FUKDA|nr:hypothetical protein H920_03081 [Fukomys damarensis]
MGTQSAESLAELCTVSTVKAGPPETVMESKEQDFLERKRRSTSSVFDSSPELISQVDPQDDLLLNQLEPPEPTEAELHAELQSASVRVIFKDGSSSEDSGSQPHERQGSHDPIHEVFMVNGAEHSTWDTEFHGAFWERKLRSLSRGILGGQHPPEPLRTQPPPMLITQTLASPTPLAFAASLDTWVLGTRRCGSGTSGRPLEETAEA